MMFMHFNYKDVFRAGRLGFSAKKMWVGFLGLLIGIVGYSILAYLAFLSSGWKWQEIWRAYRYIPIPYPLGAVDLTPWGWVIWGVGSLFLAFVGLLTLASISKITFEQLRGDEFYEAKEAARFALKNWKGVFLSPVTLLIFIGVILLIGFVFGLWGRLPYFGQLFTGIFAIPIFAGALFCVYLMVVFLVSLFMAPAIVATTESDTFDTLFETFSVINDQPWRFVLWEVLLTAVKGVGVFILAWFAKQALLLTDWALRLWQGPRGWMSMVWSNGIWYLPTCPPIPALERICEGCLPTLLVPHQALMGTWADKWGGFFMGLSFYFVGLFVLAFGMSIWASGQTLIYTVLVKIKDEKNLLEKKEEVMREERVEEKPEEEKEEEAEAEDKKSRRRIKRKGAGEKPAKKRGRPKKSEEE